MSTYPCKYLSTRKCCCCFNCDPRQVFLILSSTCLLLGLINMCSYPLCPAIIISSLVLAFYYFGSGIFLLYAITGIHEKLLKGFPWLMLFSYIPIAAYIGCVVSSLDCIKKWTTHYSLGENPKYAEDMFIGLVSLYSMFAVVNFLFSTYALMLSMGQLDQDKTGSVPAMTPNTAAAMQNPFAPYAAVAATPTQVAYATVSPTLVPAPAEPVSEPQTPTTPPPPPPTTTTEPTEPSDTSEEA